jgi:serine-type D-Ala-D-Ala carboxypeptidase/endopeptidase
MRRNPITLLVMGFTLAMVPGTQGAGGQSTPVVPNDTEIREILVERIDKYRQSVGIVVGVIEPRGRRVVAYGRLDSGDSRPLDGDTVFEIGSITKVFTSLLLADMVQRGEVGLTDPVANYLPSKVRTPERGGEQITLKDLASHTSALPRMPSNVDPADPANPFADYSVDRLYEFLSSYRLPRDIGSRFEYSNIGGALLGHALAQRAGTDYETLVEDRITQTLGMPSTRIHLTPEMQSRLAVGHAYGLAPTPNWDLGALVGAGALRSTASDLLTFLAANLGYTQTRLAPAMASMLKGRRNMGQAEIGLAWFVDKPQGVEIVFHEGSTGGYRSFIGYDPKAGVGVVVLSNTGTGPGITDIGIHLLSPGVPLLSRDELQPVKERKEIPVNAELLDRYVGHYQFPSSQMANVTRDGSHLILQGEGDVKIEFYAESPREFFAKIMDAQISFEADPRGQITELLFYRSGSVQHVRRIE